MNAIKQYRKIENSKKNEIVVQDENKIQKNGKVLHEKENEEKIIFPEKTMIGALSKYIQTPNENFQPMNANFGIMPELSEKIRDKKLKYDKLANIAIDELNKFIKTL